MSAIKACPFCSVPADEIIAESESFRAVYNIAPILPGHCLIVPKEHQESLLELSDAQAAELMLFGRKIAGMLRRAFGTRSFNWTIQEKEEAGQTVPHLHLHLIPRKAADLPSPGDWYPLLRKAEGEVVDSEKRARLSAEERARMVRFIRGG